MKLGDILGTPVGSLKKKKTGIGEGFSRDSFKAAHVQMGRR